MWLPICSFMHVGFCSQADLNCWDKLSFHYSYFKLQFKSNYRNPWGHSIWYWHLNMVQCLRKKGKFIGINLFLLLNKSNRKCNPSTHVHHLKRYIKLAQNTRPCISSTLPLRCEILLFADLHEFGGQPVGLKGQRSLSCLYRVWNERTNVFQ